jgi:hypothetical protein
MPYHLEWTEPAEKSYCQIRERAEACLAAGQNQHPAVMTLKEVDQALDTTLAQCPCDPRWSLVGLFNIIYKLPLRSVSISYCINPSEPAVIVLNISRRRPGMRKRLNTAIDDGSFDDLLAELGIEKPLIKIEVSDDWLF